VVNVTPQPLYPWDRDPLPILQEPGWVSKVEREWCRPVFLNRLAAARYRALASIIPGCERVLLEFVTE